MAEKKNLNNPNKINKPGTEMKTRSTKAPARMGGGSSKIELVKTGRWARPNDAQTYTSKTEAHKSGKGGAIVSNTGPKTKDPLRASKKDVKNGKIPSEYAKSTKKGTQLAANKAARAKKGK